LDLKELRGNVRDALTKLEAANDAIQAPQEGADVDVLKRNFDDAKAEHATACERLEQAEAVEEARAAAPLDPVAAEAKPEAETADTTSQEVRTSNASVTVGDEPLVYRKDEQYKTSFYRDLLDMKSDPTAAERVMRHQAQTKEQILRTNPNSTAGQGGEFVPPLWLQEDWIKLAKAGRTTADLCRQVPLPQNTNSINFPTVATGATTATQSDAGSVSSTDVTTSSYAISVRTIAGQQDISQQLLDRSIPGFDQVIFEELHGRYAINVDSQVITGDGNAPNLKGLDNVASINTVTYTQTTPAVGAAGGLYAKIASAVSSINTTRYLPPNVIVMHPRRWAFIVAASDSNNRPLLPPTMAQNPVGVFQNVAAESIVGSIQNLPVVIDPNITTTAGAGTNEDAIYVLRSDDLWLMEDDHLRTRVLSEVLSGTLQVRLQLYNYLTFGVRYAKSICKISGTGLVTPTF
jgi:HK97 family phage major capsid protein